MLRVSLAFCSSFMGSVQFTLVRLAWYRLGGECKRRTSVEGHRLSLVELPEVFALVEGPLGRCALFDVRVVRVAHFDGLDK